MLFLSSIFNCKNISHIKQHWFFCWMDLIYCVCLVLLGSILFASTISTKKSEKNKIFINQPSTRSTILWAGWSGGWSGVCSSLILSCSCAHFTRDAFLYINFPQSVFLRWRSLVLYSPCRSRLETWILRYIWGQHVLPGRVWRVFQTA